LLKFVDSDEEASLKVNRFKVDQGALKAVTKALAQIWRADGA